ncbi:MAG: hypothetical protein KTR26_15795 [Flammeovirgaceae bacterium]|nr:hypothetical protein [Flammeovirgaceae bacterium]
MNIQEQKRDVPQILKYPSRLLRIETSRQLDSKQIELFAAHDNFFLERLSNEVDKALNKILELRDQGNDQYCIEIPRRFKDLYLNHKIKKGIQSSVLNKIEQISSVELTGLQVRVLTAIVALAQIAKSRNTLFYSKVDQKATFEFTITSLYRLMGLSKRASKKERDSVKSAIAALHYKEFVVPILKHKRERGKVVDTYRGIEIRRLVEIKGVGVWEKSEREEVKVIVDAAFFDFEETDKKKEVAFFQVPGDLNKKLKVNQGRPNKSVELFIKFLYQSIHCLDGKTIIEFNYSTLKDVMDLTRYNRQGQPGRIPKVLEKAFDTAIKLNLIKKVKKARNSIGGEKYILTLKETI